MAQELDRGDSAWNFKIAVACNLSCWAGTLYERRFGEGSLDGLTLFDGGNSPYRRLLFLV